MLLRHRLLRPHKNHCTILQLPYIYSKMDGAHLHLVLNHFPILGSLFGLVILAYGLWSKNKAFINIGLIGLIAIALFTIPAFLSGEAAEEVIEHNPGVSEHLIEDHEERGKIGFLLMELLGIMSMAALFLSVKNKKGGKLLNYALLIFAILVFGFMVTVGNSGGKINHPELREVNEPPSQEIMEHDDDD